MLSSMIASGFVKIKDRRDYCLCQFKSKMSEALYEYVDISTLAQYAWVESALASLAWLQY